MIRPWMGLAAALPLLAACAPSASLQPARAGTSGQGDGRCKADGLTWAVGREATQATMTRIWQESGATMVRPIASGQPADLDLRPDRLNVFLDGANRIARVTCG